MNDEELIDYFEIHSRTERPTFPLKDVARLCKIAGRDEPPSPGGWSLLDEGEYIQTLIREARAMMKAREHVTRAAAERKESLTEHDHEMVSRFVRDLELADPDARKDRVRRSIQTVDLEVPGAEPVEWLGDIWQFCSDLVFHARRLGRRVEGRFNGRPISAEPNSAPGDLVKLHLEVS